MFRRGACVASLACSAMILLACQGKQSYTPPPPPQPAASSSPLNGPPSSWPCSVVLAAPTGFSQASLECGLGQAPSGAGICQAVPPSQSAATTVWCMPSPPSSADPVSGNAVSLTPISCCDGKFSSGTAQGQA